MNIELTNQHITLIYDFYKSFDKLQTSLILHASRVEKEGILELLNEFIPDYFYFLVSYMRAIEAHNTELGIEDDSNTLAVVFPTLILEINRSMQITGDTFEINPSTSFISFITQYINFENTGNVMRSDFNDNENDYH